MYIYIGLLDGMTGLVATSIWYTGTVCNMWQYNIICFIPYSFKRKGQTVTFDSPPKVVLDRFIQQQIIGSRFPVTKHLGMVLFSDKSFLHCLSISIKWECVLFNRDGRSVFPSLCTNGSIMVYCHIPRRCYHFTLAVLCVISWQRVELHDYYLCLTYAARGTSFH